MECVIDHVKDIVVYYSSPSALYIKSITLPKKIYNYLDKNNIRFIFFS